ncbi:MAG: MMPL family transporter [Flavobacteriales bacterium]|nr:MMPL family transporter [Flavobacteriales bacterium]
MKDRITRIEGLLDRRNAWTVLCCVALITIGCLFIARHVRFDFDFERFFPTDDPELDRYIAFRDRFGSDTDLLLIGLEHDPSVFDRSFLVRTDSLARRLARLPDIEEVHAPTTAKEPRSTPFGPFAVPWLRTGADSLIQADSARIWRDGEVRDLFFTRHGDGLLILLRTASGLSKSRSDSLLMRVERTLQSTDLADARIAGRIQGQYHYIREMQRELVIFFTTSVLLLIVVLAFTFRSWWSVLVPVTVVGLTVLWQVALMTLLGKALSVLTMLLPTILFVVGMSDVVHILERYREALGNGHQKRRALALAMYEVGLATFLTSLTTAVGFLTLHTSAIRPIREFGTYTALGVGLAYVLAFTLLPAVLLLVPAPRVRSGVTSAGWPVLLQALYDRVMRGRRLVLWGFTAVLVASALLVPRIKVNNYLLEDWPEDDPHKVDFHYFEKHFGGVRPFELEVTLADTTKRIWDADVLAAIDRVGRYAERTYGADRIASPATLVERAMQVMHAGDTAFRHLPDDPAELAQAERLLRQFAGPSLIGDFVSADGRYARITGRMEDQGGYVHRGKNAAMNAWLDSTLAGSGIQVHQTGMAYLIDRNNETLSRQMLLGLSLAFILIAAIMGFVFRDGRVTLIALLPNIFPLVVIAGVMGLTGIDLKVSTSIIFTIAFGIAVDDTIHLLGKLRIERAKGFAPPEAMQRAYVSAGRAVIVTSIMLCSGFVTLIASDFASVHYMGLLVSITLLVALLADLLLLPVLVRWLLPR